MKFARKNVNDPLHGFLYIMALLCSAVNSPVMAAAPAVKVEQRSYPADSVSALEVRNTSGNVIVTRSTGATASVTANKKDFGKDCHLLIDKKKSLLSIVVSKSKRSYFGTCNVEIVVTVPSSTALDLRTGAGDISATNLNGGITFRTGSGDVELNGKFPKIDGRTGSGDVIAYDLIAEDVEIATGSGDLKLTYFKVPVLGRVDLKTGSGDTIVSVPKGSKLRSSLVNGMGDVVSDLDSEPDAKFDVSARSGSASTRISRTQLNPSPPSACSVP